MTRLPTLYLTFTLSFIILGLLGCSSNPTQAQDNPEVELEVAFPNLTFSQPVDLQHAGDGTNRLFVVEQEGVIRVFDNDRETNAAPAFLDIRGRVRTSGNEEGLLGLAFHPDYAANGRLYVYYSASNPRRSVLARYLVDPADPNQALRDSEVPLLEVLQPFGNHNGGQIRFGPDGYLYVALGDGGSGGDPREHGQNRETLLGSLLRLDVDNPDAGRAYGIPPDNPFAGIDDGSREEIYAYGFRNPWRFSFDAQTGTLWSADVGQDSFEEVNLVESGGNYGWNTMEGRACFDPPNNCSQDGLTLPVWVYPHNGGARSVTGGFVYRGELVPALEGWYLYADFITGEIWALDVRGGEVGDNIELMDTRLNVSAFGTDEQDELYFTAFDGRIYRFISPVNTATTEANAPAPSFQLYPNYPNPFRAATTLSYTLAHPAPVELLIFDVLGRRVRTLVDGLQGVGQHRVHWDGHDAHNQRLPSGVYLYQLRLDGALSTTQRMVLMR